MIRTSPGTHFLRLLLAASFLTWSHGAMAVDKFSRACNFTSIPYGSRTVAAEFFVQMGADTSVRNLPNQPLNEQEMWWILESLTTDYFSVRYYLFASSRLYWGKYSNDVYGPYTDYNFVRKYDSKWSADEVLARIRTDPTFKPYYANRGPAPFYSARAGDPRIVTREVDAKTADRVMVVGKHSYYDPVSKVMVDAGQTVAFGCNLSEFGQYGLFNR